MRELQLSDGTKALVDDEDYEACLDYSWTVDSYGYPVTSGKMVEGVRAPMMKLHHFIGERVEKLGRLDHKDRDTRNAQRDNLRPATASQNQANKKANNKLNVKGVRLKRNRYEATITANGNYFYLGTFDTIQAASDAYYEAAKKYFGEFARR